MHSEQLCCSTSFFSKFWLKPLPLAVSPVSVSITSVISPGHFIAILRLSTMPLQGTPMITSCSRLILFSMMWVTMLRESQPLATTPIFSLRSVR